VKKYFFDFLKNILQFILVIDIMLTSTENRSHFKSQNRAARFMTALPELFFERR